ncbi:hypothetical protein M0R45_036208 [Rubus argutus]|uniref:Uncharacterized protein n=1 Tax=Rubus argutus TaxID=59490 RepID=A0AAW1VZ13_RUBAR
MSSKRKPLSEAAKARLRRHLDFDQFVETYNTVDEVRNTMLNIICPLIFQLGVAQNLPILNGAATSSPRISINEPHTIIPSNTNVESLEFTARHSPMSWPESAPSSTAMNSRTSSQSPSIPFPAPPSPCSPLLAAVDKPYPHRALLDLSAQPLQP